MQQKINEEERNKKMEMMGAAGQRELKRNSLIDGVSKFTKNYAIVLAILALIVIFSVASEYFLTYNNVRNILQQTSSLAIVAIGQAFIILTGEFDLSLGQNVCVTSCLMAWLMKTAGLNPWLSIVLGLGLGVAVGLGNGILIAYAKIPCFVVTLGFQMICKGLAKIITNAAPIPSMPSEISFFGRGYVGGEEFGIPISVVIMIALYAFFIFVSLRTKFGRSVFAIGGGAEASYFAGINVKKYRLFVYMLAGGLSAFGGLILLTRLDSAAVTNGNLYEFDTIIASVIGGVSLAGGKGKIIQALLGAIFLTLFFNGMTMLNVNPFVQDVLKGIVLIGAVAIDVIRNRRK